MFCRLQPPSRYLELHALSSPNPGALHRRTDGRLLRGAARARAGRGSERRGSHARGRHVARRCRCPGPFTTTSPAGRCRRGRQPLVYCWATASSRTVYARVCSRAPCCVPRRCSTDLRDVGVLLQKEETRKPHAHGSCTCTCHVPPHVIHNHMCMCICMCMCMYACACACIHMHVHVHVSTCMCMCACMRVYALR